MKLVSAVPVDDSQGAALKVQAYHQAETARTCYIVSNSLVLLTMVLALLPISDAWIWIVVWSVSVLVTVFGAVMILKRAVGNGLISLLFAWLILPAWVLAVPFVRTLGADAVREATAKTPAQRIAEGQLAKPITPSPEDGSIAEAKEWIENSVINSDAVKYQQWSTTQQGEQISTVVTFTTNNNRDERVQERLKFIFNRFEKQPVSVYNQKTNNFLFERPRAAADPAQQAKEDGAH